MEVIATKVGFYGRFREVGDKFEVPDGSKASWYEPVKPTPKPEAKTK